MRAASLTNQQLKMRLHIELSNEARDNSEAARQICDAVRRTSETTRQNGLAAMFTLTVS